MLDNLIRFSLKNRILVLAASILVLLYGIYVGNKLPIDVFPNLNRPTVTILTEAHGLAPEEVETLVTFPLEVTLNGIPGLKRLRSSSGVGLSMIWLEFEWGTDIYLNRQLVSERLSLAKENLSTHVSPVMGPITSIMGEIQLIGISTDDPDISGMKLREIADWTIRPQLLSISGIAQVIPIGGGVKQYQIYINSTELKKRNLSLEDIEENLRHISENTTGGFLDEDKKEYLIRNLGRVEGIEDIENAYVGEFQGKAVLVSDIAEVKIGKRVMRGDASVMGQPGVILAIKKQPGSSTLNLTRQIESAIADLRLSLPKEIKINSNLFKQSHFIEVAIENVTEAVRDGAILVAVILILFLMNLRTTLITLSAIPISLAITIIVFHYFGLEINTMTLGGLAIAVGLLVDDAIVDVENVYRRLRENSSKKEPQNPIRVIFEASKEIRGSVLFATLIVVLAFLPLFFLGGLEGRFFTPLGISFVVSLLASLIVSLSLTPVLCSYLLKFNYEGSEESDGKLVQFLKNIDRSVLNKILDRPSIILVPTAIAFIISAFMSTNFSKEFLPQFNEGTALVSLIARPGISLPYSNELGLRAEKIIMKIPDVISVSRRTGRAELDEHAEGVNVSEIDIDFNEEGRDRQEVLNEIREKLEVAIPEARVNVGQPISHRLDHMLSGVNAQIAIKIFGHNYRKLQVNANRVLSAIEPVDGVVDAQIETQVLIPQLKSYLMRDEANQYNLNVGKIADLLELGLQGEVPAMVIEGNKQTEIFVRLDDKSRSDIENIKNLLLKTMPDGSQVLLSDVADVYHSTGPNMFNRENMQRRIVVQANVTGRPLSEVVADIRKSLKKNVKLDEGFILKLEGQFKTQQEASKTILLLSIFSFIGIMILLFTKFHGFSIPFQILINIPLAFIGSVVALWLTDKTISLASMVAFITLCGIASRNGILMIGHYLHLIQFEGHKFDKETIIKGSLERLVPVLMTATSAILALIPLLFSKGAPGKEILHPVAVVIVGGLISSTFLDIWVTPVVFHLIGKKPTQKYIDTINSPLEDL